MKSKTKNQVIHAVSESLFQNIELAKTPEERRRRIVGFVRAASILMDESAEAWLMGHSLAAMVIARTGDVITGCCRICGCTNHFACSTPNGPCHWAEPNLCSACVDIELPEEFNFVGEIASGLKKNSKIR